MSEWKEYKMSDLIDDISMGPFGSNIKVDCFVGQGVPVLNGSNLVGFKLCEKSFNYVTKDKADSLGHSNAYRGDVIVTHRGTLGQIAYIPYDSKYERYVISQSQFRFSCKKELVNIVFLVYYFHSREGQFKLLSNASQVGVPALARPTSTFKEIHIKLPPMEEQKRIAGVLSSLDDKIDLLNRENATLEAIAETLFRHYFIENPDPTWKEMPVSYYGKVICGKTPSKKNEEYYGGEVPFIKIPDMHGNTYVFNSEDTLSEKGKESQKEKTLPKGSIMVSCIATVGLVSMNAIEAQTNQQINSVVPNDEQYRFYLYCWFKSMYDELNTMASGGTATLNLNTGDFSRIGITLPDDDAIKEFHLQVKPIFAKIRSNQQQMQTLTIQRDTLLPRLMSGEVKISGQYNIGK